MLYIFDKDETLVSGAGNRPANTPEEQVPLPGVVEKLAALRAEGHHIGIASNQGGVAWGFISLEQAGILVRDCADKVSADIYLMSPFDPKAAVKNPDSPFARDDDSRKPNPGMLWGIMRDMEYPASDTIFVGDMDSDRQAAENAGVKFVWAKDFFGW